LKKIHQWWNMPPIRLLLLDDHILFREGLSRLFHSEPDFETVALCGTSGEALQVLARSEVDIVLLDFELEDDLATRFISAASAAGYRGKILMVTAGMSSSDCTLLWGLGVAGVFLKHSSPLKLVEAIRTVAGGGVWADPRLDTQMAAGPSRPSNAGRKGMPRLTPREQEVLRLVFEGLTNKEIAHQIGASLSSVKATLQILFEKTGVRTRGQLVRIAIERSLEPLQKAGEPLAKIGEPAAGVLARNG
jgi:DNA-binding NarL/FixJ family response regulator